MSSGDIKTAVRERYGKAALQVAAGSKPGCCGGSCGVSTVDPITSDLYADVQIATLPAEAVLASLGCGNPTALAALHEGEVVLDLGSGGGIDVLLSAQRVGPGGKAYGLDMTDEMLALARENQRKAGIENVEFLKGDIEDIPLPDASVDVIISNCVVNLAARQAEGDRRGIPGAQARRALRGLGRGLSRRDSAGGAEEHGAVGRLHCRGAHGAGLPHAALGSGFEHIDIEPTRIYEFEDAKAFLTATDQETEVLARQVGGRVMGAFIRARKPRLSSDVCEPE